MNSQSNAPDALPPGLEEALATVMDDDSPENRAAVLLGFATSPVTVMLDQPWDGESLPDADTRFLLVSDGADADQPMLAVFSTGERAQRFRDAAQLGGEFEHVVEVSGSWSLLSVTNGMGVMIDPNLDSAFRIGPEMAEKLRDDVQEAMERVADRHLQTDAPDADGGA